ncbi:hypothetical protein Tco_0823066 [Tanacetum coccineum]|uniref:Gag-Pol polyprotein n=1 Tax=Tanacetum coccineum TaxID=301880 RepID=A0ABQ5AJV0_9ASTR
MCMFALTVTTAKLKNIKEAMTDSAWIEAMQEELLEMILETDGNMIAGKVATHGIDGGSPLSQQVPKFSLKVFFFCEVGIEDCGRNAHHIKPCLASSGVFAAFSRELKLPSLEKCSEVVVEKFELARVPQKRI